MGSNSPSAAIRGRCHGGLREGGWLAYGHWLVRVSHDARLVTAKRTARSRKGVSNPTSGITHQGWWRLRGAASRRNQRMAPGRLQPSAPRPEPRPLLLAELSRASLFPKAYYSGPEKTLTGVANSNGALTNQMSTTRGSTPPGLPKCGTASEASRGSMNACCVAL